MLSLNLTNEPEWVDLGHGVSVQVRPITTACMVAARSDEHVRDLADNATDDEVGVAFAAALARAVIVDWDGVGDADGNPMPVSGDAIGALLDVFPMFEAFQAKVVEKGLMLDAEKNASAPSPTGSSAGATNTAKPVKASARTARKP